MPADLRDPRRPIVFRFAAGSAVLFAVLALTRPSVFRAAALGPGASVAAALPLIPVVCGVLAAVAAAVAVASRLWGARLDDGLEPALAKIGSPYYVAPDGPAWVWPLAAFGLTFLFDGPSLAWGYFKGDDFVLLAVAGETSFWTAVGTTHNDHTIPLLRAQFYALHAAFGPAPLPFNVWALASFWAALTTGCLLLREAGLSRFAVAAFLLACVGWTLWGEFTTGYYTLLKYLQITACGAFALREWLRWRRTGARSAVAGLWLSIAVAGLLNVSGLWAAAAVVAFAACDLLDEGLRLKSRPPARLLVPVTGTAAVAAAWAALHAFLYSLPGNTPLLSEHRGDLSPASFATQIGYLVGSAALSFVVPAPHLLSHVGLLVPGLVGSLAVLLTATVCSWRNLEPSHRRSLVGVAIAGFGYAAMVALGRPTGAADYVVGIKFLGPIYFWLCVAAAFVWEGLLRGLKRRLTYLKATGIAIACVWTVHVAVDAAIFREVPFFRTAVGRWGELRARSAVRRDLAEIRERIVEPLAAGGESLILPDVDGKVLTRLYPSLELSWGEHLDLAAYREVLAVGSTRPRFVRDSSDRRRPAYGAVPVPSVVEAVSPAFLDALAREPNLQRLLLADAPTVEPRRRMPDAVVPPVAADPVEPSGDNAEILVRDGRWRPDKFATLWIDVTTPESGSASPLVLVVEGTLPSDRTRHEIALAPGRRVLRIGLDHWNAYLLNREVRRLALRVPDGCRVHAVGLTGP